MNRESWYARLTMCFVLSCKIAAALEVAAAISKLHVAGGSWLMMLYTISTCGICKLGTISRMRVLHVGVTH